MTQSLTSSQRGNVVLFIIIGFLIVLAIPPLIITMFPAAALLFQVIMIFTIFTTVRQYIGDGMPTYIVSGILIYFLVFRYPEITSSLWVFQMLMMFGFTSAILWGIGTRMK